MKAFGFLSFGHYTLDPRAVGPHSPGAKEMLHQAIDLAVKADKIGVNGAYFRVHHFVPQAASPMPLLSAIAARTENIEVGTGVIDMRYENPLYLAEEAAQLDLIANNRIALGVSRGSPEPAHRGWEAFGYHGSTDPRGEDIGREHFRIFLEAIRGEGMSTAASYDQQYPRMYREGAELPVLPHSPGLDRRVWWGAGSTKTAEWAAEQGVNLMSSTLLTEANGEAFADLQAGQLDTFREAFKKAGHGWTPRTSVSRSIFPILSEEDRLMFGMQSGSDQIGMIDGFKSTFGRTYADEPDKLIEQLKADAAVMSADTLMLTIPSQLGVEANLRILRNFAEHVVPALGWQPNHQGPVQPYEL
ncbi:MAG TPA: LLM class flavin-dependent oxidoreductase [Candidatus Corynebacterium gallistercoris]|uniref:LLM class flavin-dependent oxidoreductase n=1 Tax=Candidatus Corynebacterium gallistercoris TaxID=2838530 RepID=A0A9D1UPY5_9CORY|nr:LLM class flavin-dependent oxidoreductase [Candidatus Corynebacterium gallistercoris]